MDHRSELVQQYHAFLCKAAWRSAATRRGRLHGTFDDWYQEASIALLDADARFDPSRGCKFITFATVWVTRKLCSLTARAGGLIHVPPASERRTAFAAAGIISVPPARYTAKAAAALSPPLTFSDADDDVSLDVPIPTDALDADKRTEAADEFAAVAFETLDDHEAAIVRKHFGFEGKAKTQTAIAAEMGISKQRVNQIAVKATRKLRQVPAEATATRN